MSPPTLYVAQILAWADAFRERAGRWPTAYSGRVPGVPGENWRKVDSALRLGLRGLPGRSSLARLLFEHRGVRNSKGLPRLSIKQVLAWADAHHRRTGEWPKDVSGPVADAPGEVWHAVDRAMRAGVRGFKGGVSLAQLLARERGVRNVQGLRPLTVNRILAWADEYRKRTKAWPTSRSGPVRGAPGETWAAVQSALLMGRRGFPGGTTLPALLAKHRGVRNPKDPPGLTSRQILEWAEAHHRRTGTWPTRESGPVEGFPGETWNMVDRALRYGKRGLRGRSSLYALLRKHRGVRRAARASEG